MANNQNFKISITPNKSLNSSMIEAQKTIKTLKEEKYKGPVEILLEPGFYSLEKPIVFTPECCGTPDMIVHIRGNKNVIISGGNKLQLNWASHDKNILKAKVPHGLTFDQLFVNGERQIMARYPNYDSSCRYLNGFADDAFDPEKATEWKNPSGGYMHALHRGLWGGVHYEITGKDAFHNLEFKGGWQNNRTEEGIHPFYRFVENIFEELDAEKEWYFDKKTDTLYYYPPENLDITEADFTYSNLPHLFEFRGTIANPVSHIVLENLHLQHTCRTFMKTKEPLLRSDWTIYRGGMVYLKGCNSIDLRKLTLDHPGGNGVFVDDYNQNISITSCHIHHAGASGVAFVGSTKAVREPLFNYHETHDLELIDQTPGPKSENYPRKCTVLDNLITHTGCFEKQSAGIQISIAHKITCSHNTIYHVPRSGININEGTWGGHVIEHNDVFDTVRETSDHGAFNSWGRDRFWYPKREITNDYLEKYPDMISWDILDTTHIRHNRMQCSNGWDIDLDDGSSNYHIYNNLCLTGGIKTREGFNRNVYNNIIINNTIRCPISYNHSGDIYSNNIVFNPYMPDYIPDSFGKEFRDNFHYKKEQPLKPAKELMATNNQDENSLEGHLDFVNPSQLDYSLDLGAPVFQLGFKSFDMHSFGVFSSTLKDKADGPLDYLQRELEHHDVNTDNQPSKYGCLEAVIKNLHGLDEQSATGMQDERGVLFAKVPANSKAVLEFGIKQWDVLIGIDDHSINTVKDFMILLDELPLHKEVYLKFWRDQQVINIPYTPEIYTKQSIMPIAL